MNTYLYPQNLKATANMWLWSLRDFAIMSIALLISSSTISASIKQYGTVTADGTFDMVDASSVGVHASLSGLNKVTSILSLGVIDFDSEKVATDLESDVTEFLKGDNWAAQYVRNQGNYALLRFDVSVGIGAYLVGKEVVDGVADTAKTIGSWVSTGWNVVTNLF